jgi:methionyl aminopeptidase
MSALGPNDRCWCGSGKKYKRCHGPSAEPVRSGRVSPRRIVPDGIEKPDYAETGTPILEEEPPVRSAEEIAAMRHAGRVAADVLAAVAEAIAPGVTTDELDAICHAECLRRGAYPSPLNYAGFPKSICTSVNEVICHGIPDSRALLDGDIVNLDVTVFVGGVHGDVNATFPVGTIDPESDRLIRVTRESMELGISAVRPGRPIREIGRAIQRHAEGAGFSVVRSYVGHGIGTQFHNGLEIPHYDEPSATTIMEPGMTFTIEPMIAMGTWRDVLWPDGWTSVTADRRRTAQFEHTLLVTDDGAEVLTVSPAPVVTAEAPSSRAG